MSMILHIFNPEHDLALAANMSNFTPPLAGRALRSELSFLPALWASENDAVLVDDVEAAYSEYLAFKKKAGIQRHNPMFVTKKDLAQLSIDKIEPWGWDLTIRSMLLRCGVESCLVPTTDEIAVIRQLSHRKTAATVLDQISLSGTIGQSFCCLSVDEIMQKFTNHHCIVLKAPWSSTGRGVRVATCPMNDALVGWATHVIQSQGSIMVEPYYPHVIDFAMEFYSDGKGNVEYLGLSLFDTINGAYSGNILSSESNKKATLINYISEDLLNSVREKLMDITSSLFDDKYRGPFGIDMMIVKDCEENSQQMFLLHPCVEINLRRTMGHVALCLPVMEDKRLAITGKPHSFHLCLK